MTTDPKSGCEPLHDLGNDVRSLVHKRFAWCGTI